MPMYDRRCEEGHESLDLYEPISKIEAVCAICGKPAPRVWLAKSSPGVIPDEIPGGVWIRHGICNPDGSPRKYYSRSEMAAEAKRRGVINLVEHVTQQGTDKSPHTSRWV
jgi:hypothetical protein